MNSGHGKNSVSVVDVPSGNVIQTLALPGAFGGVAITPDGARAHISAPTCSTSSGVCSGGPRCRPTAPPATSRPRP
ncbi:MAG: hypothetical protein ABI950_06100, partial [Solirubrobacteraceae bacterium]